MRSPTSGIVTQQTAQGAYPGFLVQLVVDGQTLRFCTLSSGFTTGDGNTWLAADVEVDGLQWTATGLSPGTLTFGDVDLIFWAFALLLKLQDAPVAIWQVYAAAPGESLSLWSGRIGRVRRRGLTTECDLVPDSARMVTPRVRVQHIVKAKYLLPAGKKLYVGAETWIVDRKENA